MIGDSEETRQRREIEIAAMNALARREHSRQELQFKLTQREFPEARIAEVLDSLAERNLQSDQRFAEAFVRMRAQRGKGPAFIRQELRQKGVDDDLAGTAFAEANADWFELALAAKQKRFGDALETDRNALAKQQRFLLQRGFTHEQVRYATQG